MRVKAFLLASVLTIFTVVDYAFAQSAPEAVTLQGRLTDSDGNPISGERDFTVSLYDAASGGSIVGSPLTLAGVPVTDGIFTLDLDFAGQSIDFSRSLWLDVTVGGETLSPRTPVRAAPYALDVLSEGGGGDLALPFSGSTTSTDPAFDVANHGGHAIEVGYASGHALRVLGTSGDALYVQNAGGDGLDVNIAEGNGVRIGTTALDGVVVETSLRDGLRVNHADRRAVAVVNESSGAPTLFLRNKDTSGDLVHAKSGTGDSVAFRVDGEGRASNAAGAGMPVAYAVIHRDGSIDRATSNVSCERSGEEYIISIAGHTLSETTYFAIVQQTRPAYVVNTDGTEYPFMHPVQVYEDGNLKVGFQEPDGDVNPAASEFSVVLYHFF